MKVLVVEDDVETAKFIQQGLKEQGMNVDIVHNGLDGLHLSQDSSYDVLILDRMLPQKDGLSILQEIRVQGVKTPVLILSAMGSITDRVEGLQAGGDDYLIKPFAFSELSARVRTLARRPPLDSREFEFKKSDLTLDVIKRSVKYKGQKIDLNPMEFKLLEFLLRRKGEVVTRTMLLEGVWGFHFDPKTNVVETHISRLRSKIQLDGVEIIKTVRGAGYIIDED